MVKYDEQSSYQNIIIMRHGPRLDNFDEHWSAQADRPWDPPLHHSGNNLAFVAGKNIRQEIGAPIHRVFVSPFLRCLQTASDIIRGLSDDDSDDLPMIKVAVEFGLSEMLNTRAIRARVAPKDGDFKFVISDCESHLPPTNIDHSAEHIYKKLPEWQETLADAWTRYMNVFRALADKCPRENLLLVTHGEGVVSVSSKIMNADVKRVEYGGYVCLRRPIRSGENKSFVAEEDFKLESHFGLTFQDLSSHSVVV